MPGHRSNKLIKPDATLQLANHAQRYNVTVAFSLIRMYVQAQGIAKDHCTYLWTNVISTHVNTVQIAIYTTNIIECTSH